MHDVHDMECDTVGLSECIDMLNEDHRRILVTGFERTCLPRTQQEDTLFTITR